MEIRSPLLNPPQFHPFGVDHWAVLTLIGAVAYGMISRTRRCPNCPYVRRAEVLLALLLLAHWPIHFALTCHHDIATRWQNALPMYLCNWAAIITGIGLLTRNRRLLELCWFWGMAGTVQGLITPALYRPFPDPHWFTFFLLHGGVVIAASQSVFGRKIHPSPISWIIAILATELYFFTALAVNSALGTNYGFLSQKPSQPSLLDFFGDGTGYLLAIQGVGIIVITLLWLPFQRRSAEP